MRRHLFLFFAITLIVNASALNALIINVPGDSTTIQAGIDGASSGDTVMIATGTYIEFNINLGSSLGISVISTDPSNPSVVAATIVDANSLGSVFQHFGPIDGTTVIAGLTITGGLGGNGGGINLMDGSPTILNNVITGNTATFNGGGISLYNSSSLVANNIITENAAVGEYPYGSGGGIYVSQGGSTPTINNNIITRNSSNGSFDYAGGGGICFDNVSSGSVTNCTITENFNTFPLGTGGGLCILRNADVTVTNTIFWDDSSDFTYASEIFVGTTLAPSTLTISYSDVEDSSIVFLPGSTLNWGPGMIDADPLFADAGNDNYHLLSESPCADAGTDAGVYDDFEGDSRPVGFGYDIGADESPYSVNYNITVEADGEVLVLPGGTLYCSTLMQNNTDNPVVGDYWLSVVLPNSNEILVPESFLNYPNPLSGQIQANGLISLSNEVFIPTFAPGGSYTLIGRMGIYPGAVIDEDSLSFQVTE